ncbi:ABC transporter substrate-binding protein [Sulfitobacter donghicola DSW-25 = KCTC 12864 = JCM 14565]|uniref:ABC transporter substrate-binding protein n=2 Tax=Sulfitobacter TaxID=60136 RepID=A0A073IF93_9RHOB|nr:extracellular solute-binding protein [Sulfitobacter donghicola]KEJ88434.1 ABC transporter substrate-binding protein [Sulfitobacter donghicola DSW-25 = KCTC 12864 = JCM 14565]
MYGDPALGQDFTHLPYANPDAPKGGGIVLGNTGGFDSLNPFVRKGTSPWQLPFFTHETLMGRSWDEPFTLYGLLAETIETDEERTWVEFTLRENTRFSDGSALTVEDVIFSFETLGTVGHPKYHSLYRQIESIEQTGERSVRLTFNTENRELALLAGLRPILSKAQWEGREIANAPVQDIPIGSGPYTVGDYEPGRFVQLTRNPDYWGADLPFRTGTHNFDTIKLDFYGDSKVLFEGFKVGEVSAVREFNAESWESQYTFPAVTNGDIVKSVIPHQKPSGMTGFVMNTRRAPFDDWRIRDALIHAFNFEYINDTLTGNTQPRITSYFSNSVLGKESGPAQGRVAEMLLPYQDTLPVGTIEGYDLPVSNGTARNRAGIRNAMAQFEAAGYTVENGKMLRGDGSPVSFSILIAKGSTEDIAIAELYLRALERLGITATIETVDDAQYFSRSGEFDFDITPFRRALSLSPGNEQKFYWGSGAADLEGSRNLMGARSPAIDAMIDEMLNARDSADFVAATRALDRILTAGRYVIPFWSYTEGRVAHVKQMKFPKTLPIYGDGAQWMPEVWWWDDNQ